MGKKDPNAPKHSMTAYTFYMVERRPQLKAQFPDWPFGEFGKTIGAEWGQMNDMQKAKYNKHSERDKMRYAREMENYVPPPGDFDDQPKKRAKAASASGGVQKRQKVSAVSWGEVGPLLRALPQAKLLNALGKAWGTAGDMRDALAKSVRVGGGVGVGGGGVGGGGGGGGVGSRGAAKGGVPKKNLLCADCGLKSANYGPEGRKKVWCAGCAKKRGVQTSAKARAASMGMQDNSGMGAPSSHSPYQQLPSMMVQNMGWQQHWSEEDGRPFWTSPDGESTWDKPSHYA